MGFELDKFDPGTWTRFVRPNSDSEAPIHSKVSFENGTARMQADTWVPEGPGVMAYSSIATRNRLFTPHLAGSNFLEFTLRDFTHGGPFLNKYLMRGDDSDHEDPVKGKYLMGFGLAIGTFQGLVGDEPVSRRRAPEETTDRVVQIHFDWHSKAGLHFFLGRNVIAGDKEKIPILDRDLHDKIIEQHLTEEYTFQEIVPNITIPGNQVTQALRNIPTGDNTPWGHRYGLRLADNGTTLSWLMDAKVMDTVDIGGFFNSSPGCVTEGAYATISGGASYQHNVWTAANLRIVGPP